MQYRLVKVDRKLLFVFSSLKAESFFLSLLLLLGLLKPGANVIKLFCP